MALLLETNDEKNTFYKYRWKSFCGSPSLQLLLANTLTTDAEIEQRAWDKLPVDAINPVFDHERNQTLNQLGKCHPAIPW
jgi:hypothetical protein